jgi:ornithine cyclodeaminase/alanine dehydrogenase-like protein (mu-crystallin family)
MRMIAREEIDNLNITNRDLVETLETAFRASRTGDINGRPKSTIVQPDGAFYIGTLATWPKRNLGIFHCIMGAPPEHLAHGEPHYRTYQLLTDYARGKPIALFDGSFTSTMLPAGITALGARAFARPDSQTATFVGAGLQSRVNLAALTEILPLNEVRILGRSRANADAFAEEVRRRGLEAIVQTDAETALRGADVIVTTVPSGPRLEPFLDPSWVSPGAFVSTVDVGRSWRDGFETFDRTVSDDRAQAVVQHKEGRMRYGGNFDTDLAELVTGARPPRSTAKERIVMIHPGNIVGVLGITALIHDRLHLS